MRGARSTGKSSSVHSGDESALFPRRLLYFTFDDGRAENWLRLRPVTRVSASAINARESTSYVRARDLNQLVIQCVETLAIRFAMIHGLTENRFKRLHITATRQLLGHAPQDDAFAVFGEALDEWLRV